MRPKGDEQAYRNVIRTRWGNAAEVVDTNRAKADAGANGRDDSGGKRTQRVALPSPVRVSWPLAILAAIAKVLGR